MTAAPSVQAPTTNAPAESEVAMAAREEEVALVEFLRHRDAACPLCEYNLRGLTSARCPECGRELRLSIGLTEPYLRAWVLLAFAAFGGGGTGLFFLLMVLRVGWPRTPGPPVAELLINVSMLYFMACIPLAAVVLLTRRRFVKMPQARQWLLAATLAGLTAVAMGLFVAFIN